MNDMISRQAAIETVRKAKSIGQAHRMLVQLPSAQPNLDEWCDDCKEYDKERHSCPRWNRVIRETVEDMKAAQPGWIPCSEEPDTNRSVFIARGHDDMVSVCIGYYDHDYKQWYEERNWFAKCLYDGLYWCEMPPLPTPYREGGQDGKN